MENIQESELLLNNLIEQQNTLNSYMFKDFKDVFADKLGRIDVKKAFEFYDLNKEIFLRSQDILDLAERLGRTNEVRQVYEPAYKALLLYNRNIFDEHSLIEPRLLKMAKLVDPEKKLLKKAFGQIIEDLENKALDHGSYYNLVESLKKTLGL